MQHYVINNSSYTSHQRQERISNDINSIIMLMSVYKKSQNNPKNNKNSQLFRLKTNQSKKLQQSQIFQNQNQELYAQYGQRFQQLTYDQLLYLLCRKQILQQFVSSFIEDKYQMKNLINFNEKLSDNIKEAINNNSPQITLSACINQDWINIFSKQDIFEDTLDLLKFNISKNWKVNQIKAQKKLKNSALVNQSSKIFQTEPNLDIIQVNSTKLPANSKSKQIIQESTRQILTGLQKLKRQMAQCQAQMNMAKNNDNRILQKNQQYSNKKKEYNQLKEIYRKRTNKKGKNLFATIEKNNKSNVLNQSLLKQNSSQDVQKVNVLIKNDSIQVKQEPNHQGLQHLQPPSQNQKDKLKQKPNLDKNKQQNAELLNQSIQLKSQKQLSSSDFEELIQILEKFNKNYQKNQRIQNLVQVQKNQKSFLVKQLLSVNTPKKNNKESIITSSKQQFLEKYVRKVFNHYILEQSKMKHLSLFDKNLSSSELDFQSIVSQNRKGKSQGFSPSMRKKFSTQVKESMNEQPGKRRMSLAIAKTYEKTFAKKTNLRERMKTIANSSLAQHQSLPLKQPQMSLQSYSKFVKDFELNSKTVALSQIIQLFSKKSHHKKLITFNEFLQLFEHIYRLECQKMQISFTPVMFDNYLKKEVFSWDKINKLLRIKTVDNNHNEQKSKPYSQTSIVNNSNPSRYKFSLVGHSGRLSEEIMQKINSSKKPLDKMPCMNRNKTLPITADDELPRTRIQIKVQEIKRLRQQQKNRKKYQLEQYLEESRMRQNDKQLLKQNFKNINPKSYSKRYRMMEYRKTEDNQGINKFSKNNTKLINLKKLHQNNNIYTQNQSQTSNSNTLNTQFQKKTQNKNSIKRKAKTLQASYQTVQSEKYIKQLKQNDKNKQKAQSHQEIVQLQKIIGIRESDEQSEYQQKFQEDYQPAVNKKNSRIRENSLYQTINRSLKYILSQQNRKSSTQQIQLSEGSTKKVPPKNKNRQEDEYLANYFSKQESHISPIKYLQSVNQNLARPELQSLPNGRQNWRVHF